MNAVAEDAGTEFGATRHIAEFVVDTSLEDVPATAMHNAKLSILDTITAGLAALDQPVAGKILAHVDELGGSPVATIMGGGGARTSAPLAAMVNGALMNLLDYDGLWHIPTYVLPAVLASSEMVDASGATALAAFVVGAEVANRIREAIDALREQRQGPTYRGWYHVSVYGPIAAAAAVSKVLGLDVDDTRAAIGIATNSAGGVRQNLHTSAKSLLSGNAASHGVHAAMLAHRGIAGDPDILEARVGLINALCLPGECNWEPVVTLLGSEYALTEGPDIKRFPSVGPTQAAIAALQRLLAVESVVPDDIVAVEARLSSFSAHLNYPEEAMTAGFSWPYILAATLVDGSFTVDHLSETSLHNPKIRNAAQLISFLRATVTEQETITITLADGRTLATDVDPAVHIEHADAAVEEKFRFCALRHLGDDATQRLQTMVMALETQPAASALSAAIALGA